MMITSQRNFQLPGSMEKEKMAPHNLHATTTLLERLTQSYQKKTHYQTTKSYSKNGCHQLTIKTNGNTILNPILNPAVMFPKMKKTKKRRTLTKTIVITNPCKNPRISSTSFHLKQNLRYSKQYQYLLTYLLNKYSDT